MSQCSTDDPGRSPEATTDTAPPGRRTTGARSRSSWCAGATTSRRSSGSASRGAGAGRRPLCAPGPGRNRQPRWRRHPWTESQLRRIRAQWRDRRRGRLERPEDRQSRRADIGAPLGGLGLHAGVPIGAARSAAARRPRGRVLQAQPSPRLPPGPSHEAIDTSAPSTSTATGITLVPLITDMTTDTFTTNN